MKVRKTGRTHLCRRTAIRIYYATIEKQHAASTSASETGEMEGGFSFFRVMTLCIIKFTRNKFQLHKH